GRIFAVVAGNRQIIRKDVLLPDAVVLLPVSPRVFINAPETDVRGQIFVIFAGQLAGFAPGAAAGIYIKAVLSCHGLLLKPSRFPPGWCAADFPAPAEKVGAWLAYGCRRRDRCDPPSYWPDATRPGPCR